MRITDLLRLFVDSGSGSDFLPDQDPCAVTVKGGIRAGIVLYIVIKSKFTLDFQLSSTFIIIKISFLKIIKTPQVFLKKMKGQKR